MRAQGRNDQAGAVFGMLIVMGVVGILLMAYLSLAGSRTRLVVRSQSWNLCLPVAEAGLEEAMAHLNHTKGRNMMTNGWMSIPTATFTKSYSGYNLGEGRYSITITNASPPVVETAGSVHSRGFVRLASNTGEVQRIVRVTTRYRPEVRGIVSRTKAVVAGNITADSYDSTSSLYSSNGVYVPSLARDNSFIGTVSTMAAQLEVNGGAKIYGSVGSGAPGGLKLPLANPTKIGDAAFVNNPASTGVQGGHHAPTDLSVLVSTVPNPPFSGAGAPPLINYNVGGTNYFRALNSGNYRIVGTLTLAGSGASAQKMIVLGNAVLWITDTLNIDADGQIIIAPTGRLTLYMEKQFYCKGRGKVNIGGRPDQFAYYRMSRMLRST